MKTEAKAAFMSVQFQYCRRRRPWIALLGVAMALTGGALAGGSPALSQTAAPSYPNSIVAIGHSGLTGYDSDRPRDPARWRHNSWATGDNPTVNSVYSRVLAKNPAVKGNNFNLAINGSNVASLLLQARKAISLKPTPDLFLVQSVDNDVACDGSDPRRYKPFGAALVRVLEVITEGAPNARIYLPSQWATTQNFANVVKAARPGRRAAFSGTGPCDFLTKEGRVLPARVAYLEKVVTAYHAQLAASCARFPNCVYDGGATHRAKFVLADMSYDLSHLSVQGHRKVAAIAWSVLY